MRRSTVSKWSDAVAGAHYQWSLRRIFKYNLDNAGADAFTYPFSLAFEWYAWRQLKHRISCGEFDVVLRVLPMSPSLASPSRSSA